MASLVIDRRFLLPPSSGNRGDGCGCPASHVAGDVKLAFAHRRGWSSHSLSSEQEILVLACATWLPGRPEVRPGVLA